MTIGEGSWQQIVDVLSRYVHIVDEQAWDRLGEVFLSDAVVDHTGVGNLLMNGVDELARGFAVGMARTPIAHHLTNPILLEGTSTTARVRSKWIVIEGQGMARSGFYDDAFVLRNGRWRIAHRVATGRFQA